MSYNFLRDAKHIKNSDLCRYDSIYGYSTDFSKNGDVDGWDIYNNIYMYGSWNNVLFGSSYTDECFIGRTEVFLSVNAEEYFFIEFMLKVVDENPNKVIKGLNKGKIMWMRSDDSDWSDDRSIEFDIKSSGDWNYYKLNLGPYRWWQGDINNLRFYPFIDGHKTDKFFLKFLRITSEDIWTCNNTQCSYYQFYTHPCPGAGEKAYCEAKSYKHTYTTLSGINSVLSINIDDYGYELIDLGTNLNMTGIEMSKVIGNAVSTINIGGYSYIQTYVTDHDTIRISSGTSRSDSKVELKYTEAAEELGFFTKLKEPNYISYNGKDPATGFDYASTRLLQTYELNSLLDGSQEVAYTHNPTQYSVEGGRRDFNEIGTSRLISELTDSSGYESFSNIGKTIIELSKRIDNNGKLTNFWVYGKTYQGAKFKVLRPHNDGSFTVIYSEELPVEDPDKLYTTKPIVSKGTCDVLVNKGDVLGVYNVDIYVGQTFTNLPDATFIQYEGDIEGNVHNERSFSYGVGGLAIYGRGDLRQNNTILDVDLGHRLNVSEFQVSGEEQSGYYEYNLASCLDVTWDVNLFGESHDHRGYYRTSIYGWHDTHTNIYYGKECLDDLIITADNGQVGETYGSDNGLATYGNNHSYFYVNGDAEWLYNNDCADISEYCGNKVPYSGAIGFQRDPIAFTLTFPNDTQFEVHKSSMYFKEENNFRGFALSTLVDPYYFKGNADNRSYILVPKYNIIYINGTAYLYGDDNNIDNYLFNNPTSDDLLKQDQDDPDKVDQHISTYFVDWTILEHEFEPVLCKGFRIYCNKHNSTKITELEVYSREDNDVSMVDNITLQFSDYGDIWRTAGFNKTSIDNTVTAFIGSTPRYFRVNLESQTQFNMRELSINVTDQTYVEDEIVLPYDVPGNSYGDSQEIKLYNTYDRPFDLTVDIPRDYGEYENIVLWNSLSSEKALHDTSYGPACLLYKNEDHVITFNKGQCASNCYVYGLNNLIEGKKAYYSSNTVDWLYFGTLTANSTIGYSNLEYRNYSKFVATQIPTSSKIWRLYATTSDMVCKVKDVLCFYQGERVEITDLILPYDTLDGTDIIPSSGINLQSYLIFEDHFSYGTYGDFIISSSITPTTEIIDNHLNVITTGSTVSISTFNFQNHHNFECYFKYELNDSSNLDGMENTFEFYDGHARIFYIKWFVSGSTTQDSCNSSYHNVEIYSEESLVFSSNSLGCYFNTLEVNELRIRRSNGNVTLLMDDDNVIHTFQISASSKPNRFTYTSTNVAELNIHRLAFYQSVLISQDDWLGFILNENSPVDEIYIISTGTALSLDAYTSYDRERFFFYKTCTVNREDLFSYFVIDFENRHSLSIVRNYGENALFDVSLTLNSSYSNSDNLIEATFDSTYDDCRFLNLMLLCSDLTHREIDKLGVYPNISNIYCEGGGLNTSWTNLGSDITKVLPYYNVATSSIVTSNTHYKSYAPSNATDGQAYKYGTEYCWGFTADSGNPILYLEFNDTYRVGAFTVHGSYDSNIPYGTLKGYKFSVDNTVSGTNYQEVFSISDLSDNEVRTHNFDFIDAKRAKFEITAFDTIDEYVINEFNQYEAVDVGFLRELEIWSKEASSDISSELWPIVCLNLRDSFNVVKHNLYNQYTQPKDADSPNDFGNNEWDNDESFFSYSDFITDNPNKVAFNISQEYVTEHEILDDTGNLFGKLEVMIASSVYLPKGLHYIDWQAYYPQNVDEISLDIDGDEKIVLFATTFGTGWVNQKDEFFVLDGGYFNIYTRQHVNEELDWGAGNIHIYRKYDLTKWVAIRRDTATNYSYDFDFNKFGVDYLGNVEFFGDTKYIPTEYFWWWETDISSLSNDYINTKVGKRALAVHYPASSDIETLRLLEADTFGKDLNWSINDSFTFHLFIDNVYNLDTSFGQVVLGHIKNTANDFYYVWNLADLSLSTGWNTIVLNFAEYSSIFPDKPNDTYRYLDSKLDIINNLVDLTTLYVTFRGVGNELKLIFDDFRIRRNRFDTSVKYSKGLCLTHNDYLMMPLSNVALDKGTIEFWVKMGVNSLSMDAFGELHAATLFTISSNTNDIIALRIKPGNWFEVFAGNIRRQSLFSIDNLPAQSFIDRDEVIHIGLVWSNDGSATDSGHTIKLFINGIPTLTSFSTWDLHDTKLAYFKLGGGIAQTAQVYNNYSAFTYENVKVYNYCKDHFNINTKDIKNERVLAPENFIELSKDNVNFYKVGSEKFPLLYEQVPSGDFVSVYVRTIKDKYTKVAKDTAQILVDWLITV